MNKYEDIFTKGMSLFTIVSKLEKIPRDFGIGEMLYPSEIHTVEAIGKYENINAGVLADVLGVTNGAITQIVNKLISKDLVTKYKLPNNKKEVFLCLTEKGKTADNAHKKFHEQMYKSIIDSLNKLDKHQLQMLTQLMDELVYQFSKIDIQVYNLFKNGGNN